jgi:SAM-dependent methyltransferase
MMTVLGLTLLFLIFCFGFVLLFGAPYLPTLTKNMRIAMDMVDLEPGQTLLELGCGDGKVLIAAAQRGWQSVGYELNPLLVIVCYLRTWRYRSLVTVKWGNFWTQDWPAADGIFVFVMQRQMTKLHTKIIQSKHKPVKLVSFAFTIPDQKPVKSQDGVYLYLYK